MASYESGHYADAGDYFQQLIDDYPESENKPDALTMYGQSVIEKQDYQSGLIAFTEVTDSYKDSRSYPVALFQRAFCEFKLERYDQSIKTASFFIKSFPSHNLAPEWSPSSRGSPVQAWELYRVAAIL